MPANDSIDGKLTTPRKSTIDAIKGILILFVIYGHASSILMTNANKDVFWLHNFFVTFQMPLFIAVSGYLFYYSVLRHSWHDVLWRKAKSILWPLVLWTVLYGLLVVIDHISEYRSVRSVFLAIVGCWNGYWFLWAVLTSSALMLIVEQVFGNKWKQGGYWRTSQYVLHCFSCRTTHSI